MKTLSSVVLLSLLSLPCFGQAAQHNLGETAAQFASSENLKSHDVFCRDARAKKKNCEDVLRAGNGSLHFKKGGLANQTASGIDVILFGTDYVFENGSLTKVSVVSDNEFLQVQRDFEARFGQPTKTYTSTSENGYGKKFDLRNAYWDVGNGRGALMEESVEFVVAPEWPKNAPSGYVHIVRAVVSEGSTKAEDAKHVSF